MPFHVYLPPILAFGPPAQIEADARENPAERLLDPPPPAPGNEVRLTTDQTGVVTHCDMIQQKFEQRGFKVVRKIVSQNPRYGVVWRVDLAVPGAGDASSRLICWKGRAGYSIFDQPLQMFDPAESIPPLGQ
jgi:hypothetical protein